MFLIMTAMMCIFVANHERTIKPITNLISFFIIGLIHPD